MMYIKWMLEKNWTKTTHKQTFLAAAHLTFPMIACIYVLLHALKYVWCIWRLIQTKLLENNGRVQLDFFRYQEKPFFYAVNIKEREEEGNMEKKSTVKLLLFIISRTLMVWHCLPGLLTIKIKRNTTIKTNSTYKCERACLIVGGTKKIYAMYDKTKAKSISM